MNKGHADWLKPVCYHEKALRRLRSWVLTPLRRGLLHEIPDTESGELLYRVLGYRPEEMPPVMDFNQGSFPVEYVGRKTKRCVDAVDGKVPVYPGIGFDIPGQRKPTDPRRLRQTVLKVFDAGAKGILISREYDEMRRSSLEVVGRAVRELRA